MFDNQYSWSNQKEKKTSDDFRFVLQAAPRINDSLNKQQLDLNLPTVAFHIFLSVLHFSRSSSVSKPPERTLCRSHSRRRLDSPPSLSSRYLGNTQMSHPHLLSHPVTISLAPSGHPAACLGPLVGIDQTDGVVFTCLSSGLFWPD